MTNIELKENFEGYAVSELVNKLNELDPADYEIDSIGNVDDLMDLLFEDEWANGCYYLYTDDNERVFGKYFKDILFICNNFGYENSQGFELEAGKLLLFAIERAFGSLLEKAVTPGTKFTRVGLDTIAGRVLDIDNTTLQDVVYFYNNY